MKVPGFASPMFIVGVSRTFGGVVPNATYRPDLWNGGSAKLDTSVVTAANQKWGIRTNGDLVVMSHGSALTHGGRSDLFGDIVPDYWQETDYLTFEVAVEGFAAGKVPAAIIACGNGRSNGAIPLVLTCNGAGGYTCTVGYQAAKFGPITSTAYTFSAGSTTTGVVKITFQVDLINQAVAAWVNGTQVAVTGAAPSAGLRFPEPGTAEGHGLDAFYMNAEFTPTNPGGADFAVYGMSFSKTLKYANKGVGAAQTPNPQIDINGILTIPGSPTGGTYTITYKGQTTAPIAFNAPALTVQSALQALSNIGAGNATVTLTTNFDGSSYQLTGLNGVSLAGVPAMCNGAGLTGITIADAYRYFPGRLNLGQAAWIDPWDVAHFVFTENPSTATRHLAIDGNYQVGGRTSSALLLNGQTLTPIIQPTFFEGLHLVADQGYGTGIMRSHVLEQHHTDCFIEGGLWAVTDLLFGANYINYFRDCELSGTDAALAMYWSEINLDTVSFLNNGRWTLRLTACSMNCRRVQVVTTGNPQYGFCRITAGAYGGTYNFDNVVVDNEGVNYGLACIYAERHPFTVVELSVTNSYFGLPGHCDMFQLKDRGPSPTYPTATLFARFVNADLFGSLVSVDGPGWQFDVAHIGVDGGSDVTNLARFPGRPIGKVESTNKLPLRYGQSWGGCSRVTNPGPSDGQYTALLPATDGVWGSSVPARWVGTGLLQGDPASSLAAYMQDHTSYGATLSGQASAFGYTTSVAASPAMANTLFGSTITGTSTLLTLYGTGLGGTFTLSYGGQTTAALAFNATAATIQAALQGLSSVGAGNMTVSGGAGGPWTISLAGTLARLAGGILGLTASGTNLTATGGQAVLTGGNTVTLYGAGLGGTFTVTFGGQTTGAIPCNASAAAMGSIMQAVNYFWAPNLALRAGAADPIRPIRRSPRSMGRA